jgi:hypothetical protein
LENEKVVTGSAKLCDVIGTVPVIMKLNPSITGFTLTALPVKLPDSYTYHLARYIAGNVPKFSAISYLHREITRLRNLTTELHGGIPRVELIKMLSALLDGVTADKKSDPANFLESKNKLKSKLEQAEFLTSNRDKYYGFYELAKVAIIQEVEDKKYQYRLTNFSLDDRALIRHNLPSILNWIRRVTYNLQNYFGVKKPDIAEIRHYLTSDFKYRNCTLNVYYDQKRKGIFMEISHNKQVISEHLLQIIEPANSNEIYGKKGEEKHARHYGIVPTKIGTSIFFNEHKDKEIFYALLKCPKTDSDLVTFAEQQLSKAINKYLSANRNTLIGENKAAVQTKITEFAGFIDTGHNFAGIKKTFLKFIRPFTCESAVNLGKVIHLKTLQPFSEHDSTFLLEKITGNWKNWSLANELEINLGGQTIGKKNPAKLMLNVHNLLDKQPQLDSLVWDDLIDTFYQLSDLSLGFKCSNGVILTPYSIYSNDIERWEHRIKIQLISIIKDEIKLPPKKEGDTAKTLGVESLLQKNIKSLKATLDKLQRGWIDKNADIKKHLEALHDCLKTAKKLNGIEDDQND